MLLPYRHVLFRLVGEDSERIAALEAQAVLRDAHIADLVDEVENLRKSREHAAVIEQAKGVIMSTTRCSADAAFAVLIAASQRENVKLFEIAQRIASTQDEQS